MKDQPILSINDVKEVIEKYKEIKKNQKISDAARRFLDKEELRHKLERRIPIGRKYKVLRRMAHLFDNRQIVKNYRLTQCFIPTIIGSNKRLRKFNAKDYSYKKSDYDEKIRNHFKFLRKYWRSINYTVKFGKERSRVALIQSSKK